MRVPSKYEQKLCVSLQELSARVHELRESGKTVVLTSGTFDILHVGHGRYLSMAGSFGDVLVVGLDSDAKVKSRKGPQRPIVSQEERVELLTYLQPVDLLYIKRLKDPKWALIKTIRPDVLIISKRSEYDYDAISELERLCGEVVQLESQAETSTTARIRNLIISSVTPLLDEFDGLEKIINSMRNKLNEITGGH